MSGSHLAHFHPEGHRAQGAPFGGLLYGPPAWLKVAGAVGLVTGTMLLPASHARWLWPVAGVLLLATAFSPVAPSYLARRLLHLSPFLSCVVLGALVDPRAGPDWRLVLARSALCLATLILLSATTPFGAILRVMRRLGVPDLLLTTMALMHRYLFVLAEETTRMRRARSSRTFVRRRPFTWGVLATVAGRLFERAALRSERIYEAMCARGWK